MWLDGLYMGAAFYAEYLYTFAPNDMDGWSDVAQQFIIIHRHTYDAAKKLNYHGWSADPTDSNSFWAKQSGGFIGCSSEFWGRGMGWYFAALTDVLEMMPQSHADYSALKSILAQVAAGLQQWQDKESGVWYQLLQYDDTFVGECGSKNYLEASASCMFTYSYLKALRLGLIPESYRATAEKAYQGVLKTFVTENSDKSLNLIKSCKSAGLGPAKSPQRDGSASYYLCGSDVTVVSNEGKSIGPFIMASLEWEQAYGGDEPSEPETPENPATPEVPDDSDEPSEPGTIVYKEFTQDMVLLTTTEKVTGRNWIEGGETSSTKAGTIDPLTGSSVDKYSGGGIMLKKGNSAKALATYVTGVSKVIAYGCTAGSSDRTLVVSATAEEGSEAVAAKATSSGYQSVAVALALDGTKKYKVEYTGVDASDEEKGSDMVLHGIKFVAGAASGISEIETGAMAHDVYTISGVKVGSSQGNLPKGIYIINTKKVVVR
jgi:rhamnogalacturonyl hydrolase YesR